MALFLVVVLLPACRESDAPPPQPATPTPQTGSITAKVVWPGENAEPGEPQATQVGLSAIPAGNPFRWVVPAGVSTIRGTVTASDITTPPETTIAVTAGDSGTGAITGVPAGTNRTLTVDGLESGGTVLYSGSTAGITVTDGETTEQER